jgi:hypothetical protein
MTSAECQNVRTILLAGVSLVLNLLLVPAYLWLMAWASIASDGLLAVSHYAAVLAIQRMVSVHADNGENVYATAN